MKIFFTPSNVASMPSFSVEALNALEGVKCIGLFLGENKYSYKSKNVNCIYIVEYPRKYFFKYLISKIKLYFLTIKYILWADVVHYIWGNVLAFDLDLHLIKFLRKKAFIEWVGSDIRIPDIVTQISPFAQTVYDDPTYEYREIETRKQSISRQRKFAKFGFIPITYFEMDLYIDKLIFPKRYFTSQRLPTKLITPHYPLKDKNIPLIIHSPTAPVGKGSKYVIEAINQLKLKYEIEFVLLNNMKREEVLLYMSKCDIFIDQLICGSHGLALCEAMAYGKPGICYMAEAVLKNGFPKDNPIVNANPDNLYRKLESLIINPSLRHELGRLSRTYVEKHHDADNVAIQLFKVYEEELCS